MCGIAGIVGAPAEDTGRLATMLDALAHRGPDGGGIALAGTVALGHRRLAIHDLTPSGCQPFVDASGSLLAVVNGEFYDAGALRERLLARGHAFRGGSDSEIVLPLWREKGAALVHDLHGPFALAIADSRDGSVFLARDRVGKKPLFWARRGAEVLFASELAPLRRATQAPLRRGVALDILRMGYVPAPDTPYEGIRSVPPGSSVIVRGGEATSATWWTPPVETESGLDAPAAVARVTEALRAAVELRLDSERPVGVFLSGGLDSAAILLLANEASAAPLPAFSLAFPGDAVDEAAHARAVARALGTLHTVFDFDGDPAAILQDLVRKSGEPLADPSWIAWSHLCERTAAHAAVVLTGDGGDETLIGYRRHRAARLAARTPAALRAAARGAASVVSGRSASRALAAASADPRTVLADLAALTPWATLAPFLGQEALEGGDPLARLYAPIARSADPAADAARVDLLTYLPGDLMPKADRGAMAWGVETRSPFLDDAFLDVALRIPGRLRAGWFEGKKPLRALLRGRVPPSVLRRKKQGLSVPLAGWLRSGPLARLAREALHDVAAPFEGVLQGDSARDLFAAFEGGAEIEPLVYACLVAALTA